MKNLLFEICNNDDTTKIHEAIEKGRSIRTSFPDVDALDSFSDILCQRAAFDRIKKTEYHNESISYAVK
jgi:hypothetical protein